MAEPRYSRAPEPEPGPSPRTNAEAVRRWRQKNPDKAEQAKKDARIRDRALRELGRRHPQELDEIIGRIKRIEITRGATEQRGSDSE